MKKMKVHIDKYLESFNDKMETAVSKLKEVGQEFETICNSLKDECSDMSQEVLAERKRLASVYEEAELSRDNLNSQSLKKLKLA